MVIYKSGDCTSRNNSNLPYYFYKLKGMNGPADVDIAWIMGFHYPWGSAAKKRTGFIVSTGLLLYYSGGCIVLRRVNIQAHPSIYFYSQGVVDSWVRIRRKDSSAISTR